MKNIKEIEAEIEKQINEMFKDRFVTDTNLFKWAGKKQFIEYIKSLFLHSFTELIKECVPRKDEKHWAVSQKGIGRNEAIQELLQVLKERGLKL